MKDKLLKILKAKEKQLETLRASLIDCESRDERAAIGETLASLESEIAEVKSMLAELDEPADPADPADPNAASGDPTEPNGGQRMLNPMDTMNMRTGAPAKKTDPLESQEYREAFMNFCCRNVPIPAELRTNTNTTKTTDASAVIPKTLVNEIISELKSYGGIYAKVRKLNVQGGIDIPILSLKPTATWITADAGESESTAQKLQANTKVSFSYYGLECKVAQTLLTNVTTIDAFESLFATLAVEAITKALEIAIISGNGTGKALGVTADTRVPNANVITLTPTEIASWSSWKKKVFGKMKKSYRDGTFYMAQSTFDGYIDGMVDSNGQPIGRVNYGIDGGETYRFGGKEVETVEDDIIAAYDSASTNDVIAVFFKPSDYAINSNLEMRTVKWEDHDTNEIKNKVIMIVDGKLIDPYGVIIIKKGAAAASE